MSESDAALGLIVVLVIIIIFFFITYGLVAPPADNQPPDDDRDGGRTMGMDPRVVRALPVVTYAPGGSKGPCVVCLGEFEEKEQVKVIPACLHVFHPRCIDEWLLLHGSCPICRCSELLGTDVGGTVEVSDSGARDLEEGARRLQGFGRSRSLGWVSEEESSSSVSLQRNNSV